MGSSANYKFSQRREIEKFKTNTCFFLRVRCHMRQHMFSSRPLLSRASRVATTLTHVRCKSLSSTLVTTSSTKYLVGLKPPIGPADVSSCVLGSPPGPLANIASRYPFIHSLPTAMLCLCFGEKMRTWRERGQIYKKIDNFQRENCATNFGYCLNLDKIWSGNKGLKILEGVKWWRNWRK